MHQDYSSIERSEQERLEQAVKHSPLASTAHAHSHESLHAMKQKLRDKLDHQTESRLHPKKTEVDKTQAKTAHESTSNQLEKQLKAELDMRTNNAAKKLLRMERAKQRLSTRRHHLAGNVERAIKVPPPSQMLLNADGILHARAHTHTQARGVV